MSSRAVIETRVVDGPVPFEVMQALDWPVDCGAECVFVGRTRREVHEEFGELVRLHYEMYEPMVAKGLRALAEEAAAKHDGRLIRLEHAKGDVGIGEASVLIQVVCGHRAESFDACRELIERLKVELPIWKREIWQRGETFVEGNVVERKR